MVSLERRADIFFALYLREMLEARYSVALDDELVPESAVKRELTWPSHQTNKSVKVDYVAFAETLLKWRQSADAEIAWSALL